MTQEISKQTNKMRQGKEMKKEPIPGKRKNVLAYPENPFWKKTEIKIGSKMVKVSGGKHINVEGESISHSGIHVVREIDEDEFVKIYTKNIKAIFDLKPTAQRVLQYLISELQKTPNADAVYLAWVGAEEYFSENHIKSSRASFHRALSELIQKGFLAESTKPNMFWFNPNLFFNGNRLTFIHEYRKKTIQEIGKEENLVQSDIDKQIQIIFN
jgi:hypothetical protein